MVHVVTESYFELLTEQEGIPMKPFDPVGELRRLRRMLALRIQAYEPSNSLVQPEIVPPEIEVQITALPLLPPTEPFSLETVAEKVSEIKKTLAMWQRVRLRRKTPPAAIFRGHRQFRSPRRIPTVATQYLTDSHQAAPQEGALETLNAGLTALGIVGMIFGMLSFSQGGGSDLSFGLQMSLSGLVVSGIGLGGRFLSSQTDQG